MIRFVQTGLQKYFSFYFSEDGVNLMHPASSRGAYASSRTRGGLRWTKAVSRDERRGWRTAKTCGPGTPGLVPSARGDDMRATVTKRSWTPGRARTTPLTPLRREGRVSRLNLW